MNRELDTAYNDLGTIGGSDKKVSRSIILFESAIKSEATKRNYRCSLDQFLKFAKLPEHDAFLTLKDASLNIMLEDYLLYLRKTISPNSIPPKLAAIELFFSMNDRALNFKKIKKMYPKEVKKTGGKAWTTEDIQSMLKVCGANLRRRAIVLFLSSTGVRIGVLSELKLKHLKDYKEGCKTVIAYPDSNEEYTTLLTPETSEAIDRYMEERKKDGEVLTDESPIFRQKYLLGRQKVESISYDSLMDTMKSIILKSNLQRVKTGKRYDIQLNHGFRKRYNTILKVISDVNPNIAEKLLGHKNGLDGVYFVPTVEQLFIEFKKAISELTVDGSERLKIRLEQSEKAKAELELIKDDKIHQMESDMMGLKDSMRMMKAENIMTRLETEKDPVKRAQYEKALMDLGYKI